MEPLFDFRDVTVYRGSTCALDRITLSIGVGEHVAILGPNGSGKSTLIKTFTRECYPVVTDEGSSGVRIMGHERWDVSMLRRMLGIVTNDLVAECTRGRSGDFAEYPRRVTGRETVLSGFFSSIGLWAHHQVTPEMERTTDEILARLEIGHLADRPLHELSAGEARRLVIGRALAHEPTALVLDEVANSLDLGAASQLREMVRLIARSGVTLVLVTHHLPEIIPEVERVILLDRGQVVADGPKDKVLTSENLSRLFRAPIDVGQRDGYFHAW
jgi:iron complex transport system ATP-binding protein